MDFIHNVSSRYLLFTVTRETAWVMAMELVIGFEVRNVNDIRTLKGSIQLDMYLFYWAFSVETEGGYVFVSLFSFLKVN